MTDFPPTAAPDVLELGTGALPIVAVHGIQGTRDAWRPLADNLSAQARWVLPNLRGRGAAVRGSGPADYTLARYADDLQAVIERHVPAGTPFVLAGWSMGVSVCLEYLSSRQGPWPQRLLLLSGTAQLPAAPWFHASSPDALRDEIAQREQRLGLRRAADHAAVAATWTAIRTQDHRGRLAALDLPTLVIHGRADPDSPWAHGQALAQGLPAAQLQTLEGAGHSVLSTHTALVAEAVSAFLALPHLSP